eukprot:GHRQ01034227.1.p2 GENE.GHRQ01034227.1~~GHRQ01034227.1.p2  ORF type:complete len:152 (-),score=50.68 GHRQ01034227.1:359-814(-)
MACCCASGGPEFSNQMRMFTCRIFPTHMLACMCCLQDTNALVFRALLAALGLSAANDYDMNSLAVPRKAKEAIGAITRLTKADGSGAMTVNVEYNQLDPLLRSTINKDGDVNDESGEQACWRCMYPSVALCLSYGVSCLTTPAQHLVVFHL